MCNVFSDPKLQPTFELSLETFKARDHYSHQRQAALELAIQDGKDWDPEQNGGGGGERGTFRAMRLGCCRLGLDARADGVPLGEGGRLGLLRGPPPRHMLVARAEAEPPAALPLRRGAVGSWQLPLDPQLWLPLLALAPDSS